MTKTRMNAFNIFLNGSLIDTVFFGRTYTVREVYDSLVNHDGYEAGIKVVKV